MTHILPFLLITVKAIKFEKVLGLFLNTMTACQKYFVLNRDNLTQPIQMQPSLKRKTFSQFLSAFLTCRLNFEHFQQEDAPHS